MKIQDITSWTPGQSLEQTVDTEIAGELVCSYRSTSESSSSPDATFAHHNERRPTRRMAFALRPVIDQRKHRLAHGFCSAYCLTRGEPADGAGYKLNRRL